MSLRQNVVSASRAAAAAFVGFLDANPLQASQHADVHDLGMPIDVGGDLIGLRLKLVVPKQDPDAEPILVQSWEGGRQIDTEETLGNGYSDLFNAKLQKFLADSAHGLQMRADARQNRVGDILGRLAMAHGINQGVNFY